MWDLYYEIDQQEINVKDDLGRDTPEKYLEFPKFQTSKCLAMAYDADFKLIVIAKIKSRTAMLPYLPRLLGKGAPASR